MLFCKKNFCYLIKLTADFSKHGKKKAKASRIICIWSHRKGIQTEKGKEFIKFLAAPAILPRTILKNRMNLSFFFQIILTNNSPFLYPASMVLPPGTDVWCTV